MEDELERLIGEAVAGDDEAQDRLLRRMLPVVRGFVRLHTGPELRQRESCSDITQSVCREVFSDLSGFEFRGEPAFRAWLCRAAERKIIDRLRYHGRLRRRPDRQQAGHEGLLQAYSSLPTPSHDADLREQVRLMEAAFDRLPDTYREALVLSHVVGLTAREVAERMDLTLAAARGRH